MTKNPNSSTYNLFKWLTMKIIIFIVLVSFALGQYFSPWSQYNPFFNGGLAYRKNLTNYPYPVPWRNFSSNGFWPSPFNPVLRGRRSVSYYQSYYCIPDYPQCNGSHSLSLGCLRPTDRILFRQVNSIHFSSLSLHLRITLVTFRTKLNSGTEIVLE